MIQSKENLYRIDELATKLINGDVINKADRQFVGEFLADALGTQLMIGELKDYLSLPKFRGTEWDEDRGILYSKTTVEVQDIFNRLP